MEKKHKGDMVPISVIPFYSMMKMRSGRSVNQRDEPMFIFVVIFAFSSINHYRPSKTACGIPSRLIKP